MIHNVNVTAVAEYLRDKFKIDGTPKIKLLDTVQPVVGVSEGVEFLATDTKSGLGSTGVVAFSNVVVPGDEIWTCEYIGMMALSASPNITIEGVVIQSMVQNQDVYIANGQSVVLNTQYEMCGMELRGIKINKYVSISVVVSAAGAATDLKMVLIGNKVRK